jgi:hypothetical protein
MYPDRTNVKLLEELSELNLLFSTSSFSVNYLELLFMFEKKKTAEYDLCCLCITCGRVQSPNGLVFFHGNTYTS